MSSADDRAPILIGAGQLTQRDVEPAAALEPLAMMEVAARRAAEDAGAGPPLLAQLDALAVVNVFCWTYQNAPGALAARLGARPSDLRYTTVGGNTPQSLVNDTADRIWRGETRLALLAGAEAVRTVLRAQKTGVSLDWSHGIDGKCTVVGDRREGTSTHEVAHGFQLPVQVYPLFENAVRAARGWSIAEHRAQLGRLCAAMAAVAADNPYAWFRDRPTAEELTTITAQNRIVGFPYPKRMNAIIDVDQAAAVLMTSVGEARKLGIPEDRWVYVWGTGEANDKWLVSERVAYSHSPAIREAGRQALAAAGVGIERIAHFDIYSCFPAAVQMGRDALGIPLDDPRPLTTTGGLPYFGGPGNDYSMHGIAAMLGRLRGKPDALGLVTALGWYVTKHAVGVYGGGPNPGPWVREDPKAAQATLDAEPAPAVTEEPPPGPGTIETYTVVHGRDGAPLRGIVVGRLDDGRRFLANTPEDVGLLETLETREGVGLRGRVSTVDGANVFAP